MAELPRPLGDHGERVLAGLRDMAETEIHRRVIMPLLKARGATHVEYVHGSFERGCS